MPEGFTVHPKLVKQLERRRDALGADGGIDWAHAEALAFASLLTEGTPIRLTGQDTERGTFSQRHMVLHDAQHRPDRLPDPEPAGRAGAVRAAQQRRCREVGCLGFEYGYSQEAPETLVLWEAQFGDFVNSRAGHHRPVHRLRAGQVGADVAADAAAAPRLRGLGSRALLGAPGALPAARRRGQHPRREPDHAGPVLPPAAPPGAHRQAAPAGDHDAEVAAAPAAGDQPLEHLTESQFYPVLGEPRVPSEKVTRLVLCTGKIYYDLVGHPDRPGQRGRGDRTRRAAVPVPRGADPRADRTATPTCARSCGCRRSRATWAPARTCSRASCRSCPSASRFGYIGRPERASPGEGYPAAHIAEQSRIVRTALDVEQPRLAVPAQDAGRALSATPGRRRIEVQRAAGGARPR